MSNHVTTLTQNVARAHADAIHSDLQPLALHPDEPSDELSRDIERAIQRHAERLRVQLPY